MKTLTLTLLFLPVAVFIQAAETVSRENAKTNVVLELKNPAAVLNVNNFKPYIDAFNADDEENVRQFYPNDKAWDFLSQNMPLFDYPDKEIEKTYYFRWWTYRKHIKETPDGFIVTEFHPKVYWAGKHNAISCALGLHFREGRWLRDSGFLNDYAVFWLRKGGPIRVYSSWIADSILQHAAVTGNSDLAMELLPDLIKNYEMWVKEKRDPNGLFWQRDGYDGMEVSAATAILKTPNHYRATINSYMFAEADAIAKIAKLAGQKEIAGRFHQEAETIRTLLHTKLWDDEAKFYKVAPRVKNADDPVRLVNVREEHGYTAWYFEALKPPEEYAVAWEQLMDPKGFYAPFGPTTCEQRSPDFQISYQGHECLWNGPSWPFATSVTLTGLANEIIREKKENADVTKLKDAYLKTLECYAKSHRRVREDGKTVCWIDENLNPFNGDWISRTRLKTWKNGTWDAGKGGYERGKDYNHSMFCDLIITGLIGLRPSDENKFELFPLVPSDIDYFAIDNIKYHGHTLAIFWDKDGRRYNRGAGFYVLIDGKEKMKSRQIPETPAVIMLD